MLYLQQDGPVTDVSVVLVYIARFYRTFGVTDQVNLESDKVMAAVRDMHRYFPYPGGSGNASPFKKAAQFICYFIAYRPIHTPLPDELIGPITKEDQKVARSNAVVAFAIAAESLHKAVLTWNDDSTHVLENRIQLSLHSFRDIIDALSYAVPPDSSFKLVSVLLEQTAYKTNPDCQYPTLVSD